jgi:hypothetical protein
MIHSIVCSAGAKAYLHVLVLAVVVLLLVVVVASISIMLFSVPPHADTLRNMLHKVRTSHGVSDEAYSALREHLYGIGQQGSGAGPAIWVALSIIMIECYKETENGMYFSDPENIVELEQWLDAFVDDAELGLNDFWNENNPALGNMIDDFKKAAQKWERCIFTSAGALELSKCSWYYIYW